MLDDISPVEDPMEGMMSVPHHIELKVSHRQNTSIDTSGSNRQSLVSKQLSKLEDYDEIVSRQKYIFLVPK